MGDTSTTVKEATLDITIATGSDLLSKTIGYAEQALIGIFKSAGADVAGIAARLAIPIQLLTVTGAKVVTAHGYDAIKITIAIRAGDPQAVAKEVFSTAVGLAGGAASTTALRLLFPAVGLVGGSVAGAAGGYFASQKAGELWDENIANSALGQWSVGKVSDYLNLGIKFTPNSLSTPLADAPAQLALIAAQPNDAATRNSSSLISSGNNHTVVIQSGGSVWDAYATQKNASNGIANWEDFKVAVTASNPQIADLNKVAAGTTLYMPEKMNDGSITYHYSNGASINSNGNTGEYFMVVPDGNGGSLVYSRTQNADGSFAVSQTNTNQQGQETYHFKGSQGSITDNIQPIVSTSKTDSNGDGTLDLYSLAVDANRDGVLDKVLGRGDNQSSLFKADWQADQWRDQGLLDNDTWNDYTSWSTTQLVNYQLTEFSPVDYSLYDPIGAFYESKSAGTDNAGSIGYKTFRILGSNYEALTAAQLGTYDTNKDGKISGTEVNGLKAWIDETGDGVNQSGELQNLSEALGNAGHNSIRASDYAFYTRGNATPLGNNPVVEPVNKEVPVRMQGSSTAAYRAYRDGDNRFTVSAAEWIDWAPTQIKITSTQKNMVGTDGNDTFDIGYYSQYDGKYFNLSLIENFYAGDGDDTMAANDAQWRQAA